MKSFTLGLFLTCFSLIAFNQDVKVTTAEAFFKEGRYETAIKSLNVALENPNALKEKNQAKAYYLRGESYIKLMSTSAYDQKHAELQEMANFPFMAMEDYFKAIEIDGEDNNYGKKAAQGLITLRNVMLQGGLTALNTLATLDDPEQRKSFIFEADKYLTGAYQIEEDYLIHDLLGQLRNQEEKREEAYEHFKTSLDQFQNEPPANPDLFIGYVAYRKALYEAYYKDYDEDSYEVFGDVESALKSIKLGEELVDKEYLRYDATGQEQAKDKYEMLKNDLLTMKLDLYLQGAGEGSEGLEAMGKAVKENPQDYILLVAYAQMLEAEDLEKAIEHYKLATEVNPDKTSAWFNLGAVYNNIATDIITAASEGSLEEQNVAEEEAKPYMQKAFDCMEECYRINPNDIEAVNALKMLAINLDDMAAYENYIGIYKELMGQ